MASVRAWLVVAVLACVLLVRQAGADHSAPPQPTAAKCNPVTNKTCRPGDPHAPENQEEEAFSVNVKPPPGPPGEDDDDDDDDGSDDLPSFDHNLVILGH